MFDRKKMVKILKEVILSEVRRADAEKLGFDPSGMGRYNVHKPESEELNAKKYASQNDEEVKSLDYHDSTVIKMIAQAKRNLINHGAEGNVIRALNSLEDYIDDGEYAKAAAIVKSLIKATKGKGQTVKELFHIYSYLADNSESDF